MGHTSHHLDSRLLVVNETGILALRAGLGPTGNRYGLERLTVESLLAGAELVGCSVVRKSRSGSGGSGSLGMVVALATVAPPLLSPGGTKQGDAAGGPHLRPVAAAQNPAATAAGALNVYALGGERSFEVERALQRQPQQQILLPYAPEGMAHTKVWRNVAAPPNFVGGEEGEEGGGEGTSSLPSPTNSNRRFRVERGDAVLVWDQDGVVHGYTRWEGGGGRLPTADSSTSRIGGGGGGSGGGAARTTTVLSVESRESLEALIPELKDIDGPVSCLSFDAVEDADGAARRCRWLLTGCKDSARCSSLDAASGRRETAVSSVAGPVCAIALNTRPRCVPNHWRVDDLWGGDVAGFACTELDMLAWLLKGGGDGDSDGGRRRPRWCTGTLPLMGAGGDQLTCIECADFCRDGSTSVVVGTNLGKVIIYGVDADPDPGGVATTTCVNNGDDDDEGLAFGLGNADFDDSNEDDDSGSSDTAARRGGCTSPRPPGGAAAAATAEKQQHNRCAMERAGSCEAVAEHPSKSNSSQPLLSVRWQRDVPYGVLSIACGDFNHDGVSELVVVTKYGVHVFHPDYREEANRFAKTMYALKMLQPKEEEEEVKEEEEEEEKRGDGSVSTTSDEGKKSSRDVS